MDSSPDQVVVTVKNIIPTPALTATPGSLSFGDTEINTSSSAQNYTLSGNYLTSNVTVTTPAGFQVSLSSSSGWNNSLSITPLSGSVNVTVYVRFSPTATGSISGNISHISTGVTTQNVTVKGIGIDVPLISIETIQGSENDSPYIDMTKRIRGTVTGAVSNKGYFIQDTSGPWSGIWVEDSETNVLEGDGIEVSGVVKEINNVTSIVGKGKLISAPVVANAIVLESPLIANDEKYESVLVQVVGVRANSNSPNGLWSVYTDSGNTLTIGSWLFKYNSTEGNFYTIKGIVNGINNLYKLEPRKESDIIDLSKTTGIMEVKEKMFSVYPNPFTDRVNFEIRLKKPAQVVFEIFTITGVKLATLFDGNLEAGMQTRFEYKPEKIPAQILLYKLRIDDEVKTGKLIYKP